MSEQKERKLVYLLSLIFLALFVIVAFVFDGIGDTADSVMHYLFSRYAFAHPANFLDHWAKPLFTLFSAPLSQFGFTGMKIFNVLVAVITAIMTYHTACKLKLGYKWLVPLLMFFSPLYFVLMFSGLTEHFFALVLITALYLSVSEKHLAATILYSFLPFARSEGLVILGVYLVFLLVKRKYRFLPWVLTGHLFYGLAGWLLHHHDFLWIFTKIPYAHLQSPYGSGDLFHFFRQLTFVLGVPNYILLSLGVALFIAGFFIPALRKRKEKYPEYLLLIYGSFGAFFVAHSLFWYLGIFNSMGLKRVLIDVMPLMVLIVLDAISHIKLLSIGAKTRKAIIIPVLFVILAFPFVNNPHALKWDDLKATAYEKFTDRVGLYVQQVFPEHKYFYAPPILSYSLNVDHFDPDKREGIEMIQYEERLPEKSLVIWDHYFAQFSGIGLDYLQNHEGFIERKSFRSGDFEFILFEYQ